MSDQPRIALVVACAENGVIGRDGGLPWRLRDDLAFFKRVTLGKPIIMGRRTWESIGRPLPGRRNIVVSRTLSKAPTGVELATSLDDALRLVRDTEEVSVIGGATLYESCLPLADVIYLTRVEANVEGDTLLYDFPPAGWQRVEELGRQDADERNEFSFVIERYEPGPDVARRGGPDEIQDHSSED